MNNEKKVTKKKVLKAKDDGSSKVTNLKPPEQEKPKKKREPKELTPAEWLEKYVSQGEMTTSGAKLVTYLLARPEGCDLKTLIQRASEIALLKQSSWGTSKTHIKSHLNFLKNRKIQVHELKEDHFRISA